MTTIQFKRSDQAIFAAVGDDVVALHVERGKCFGMENVTAAVWNLLSEPLDLDQLCDRLTDCYDVELDRCRAEVSELVGQMVEEGLVERLSIAD